MYPANGGESYVATKTRAKGPPNVWPRECSGGPWWVLFCCIVSYSCLRGQVASFLSVRPLSTWLLQRSVSLYSYNSRKLAGLHNSFLFLWGNLPWKKLWGLFVWDMSVAGTIAIGGCLFVFERNWRESLQFSACLNCPLRELVLSYNKSLYCIFL